MLPEAKEQLLQCLVIALNVTLHHIATHSESPFMDDPDGSLPVRPILAWIPFENHLSSLHYARATLSQRHAALLVANNAVCLMSGFDHEV